MGRAVGGQAEYTLELPPAAQSGREISASTMTGKATMTFHVGKEYIELNLILPRKRAELPPLPPANTLVYVATA